MKTKRQIRRVFIGGSFLAAEAKQMKVAAKFVNPACPKRIDGMRYLMNLGWEAHCLKHGITPSPSLPTSPSV